MSNISKIATIGQVGNVGKTENVSGKFFEIPPYQRLYEWGKEQIETLLNDMKKAFDLDKEKAYFIGNITTSIYKDDNNKFILIDGQQRLTTLWFIGFYLASRDCGEWQQKWKEFILQDDKLRIAMPIRDNETKALKELARKIIEPKDNRDKYKLADSLPSNIHTKIKNAFKCIETWFNNVENIQENKLQDFAEFIYTKVCFVFVELAQNTDLNRFFVRMNNRGKQLEQHEILKARILHKISEKEQEKYAEIWDLCSDMNRYIFQSKDSEIYEVESIIDFPTFLLHCYKISMIDNLPQKFTISKDKLLEFIDIEKLTWEDKNCKEFIESMLRYRVLFDGFVIKFTAKKGKETNEKESPYKIKRLSPDNNLVNSNLNDLEMIQNYLRVARQGDRQNYHHWLTPFLQFLHKSELINYDYIKISSWKPDKICENFSNNDNSKQNDLVKFLETLDTNLAIARLSGDENSLLDETNKAIQQAQNYQPTETPADIDLDSLLNNGTGTPHYWFYRLEYYLWKNRENKKFANVSFDNQFFKNIADKFYFRNLNSVEHIQPQSKAKEKDWQIHDESTKDEKRDIDCFGNLALLSVGFNSSLINQNNTDKRLDLQKKINKSEVESLKLWLVYANYPKDENWTCKNAKKHLVQMLRVLKKSLGLNLNDSQDSSESQETK